MRKFFGKKLLLGEDCAEEIYGGIKDLPIIDYHCHLDQKKIAENATFSDIGELWLAGDHYKWRAMRLCGVDEKYITGEADFKEKFQKYAEIVPLLAGNPLYYWTHMELSQVFGIDCPLNGKSAAEVYAAANEKLKKISVGTLLSQYKVEYVATTDDPADDLSYHGKYANTQVSPTFRPDKLLSLDDDYLEKLGKVVGYPLDSVKAILRAAEERLIYFKEHGCKISDHGFCRFPTHFAAASEAELFFGKRKSLSTAQKDALFGYLLVELMKLYAKHSVMVQLHFSVTRNVNAQMFKKVGVDAGFDVIASAAKPEDMIAFFSRLSDEERPETILYTLNDSDLASMCCLTGAYRKLRAGAAWWFNDTVEGIRKNLKIISEYSVLGTNFGMLTDSRSFSSYARFDFFRRILADHLGELVEKGEYDLDAAKEVAKKVSYYNIKGALQL